MIALSIIIPIYNVKVEYFSKCIESVCNQSLANIEIILIDDGSTTECGTLCDEYAKLDTRIRVIHQDNNGVSVARNQGIRYASGKYVMFVDADDLISTDICKNVFEQMEKHSDDILIFQYTKTKKKLEFSQNKGLVNKQLDCGKLDKYALDVILEKDSFEDYCIGAPWAKTFKRDFLMKNNLKFISGLKKMEDRLFMLYCLKQKPKVGLLGYMGYYYNTNDESVSIKLDQDIEDISDRIIEELNIFNSSYKAFTDSEIKQVYILLFFKCLYSNCFHTNNKDNFFYKVKQLYALSKKGTYKDAIETVPLLTQTKKRRLIILLLRFHLYSLIILYVSIRNSIEKNGVK